MKFPADLLYNDSHEWVRRNDNGLLEIGITDFAQSELGDVVYAEPPADGLRVQQGDVVCSLESVKAVSDIYAPAAGTVKEFNEELADAPELINQSPYEKGWLFRIQPNGDGHPDGLLDSEAYQNLIGIPG